ncbi:MAG TPA: hypothetical protein VIH08_08735, partial [Blastococcus sp.]
MREPHVLGKAPAGCHGHRTYCGNRPGPLNLGLSGADTVAGVDASTIVGLLADPTRLRVVAALALGAR